MEIQQLLAHGHRTNYLFGVNPQALPSGSATYAGRFRADAYKMTDPSNGQRVRYSGAFLLSANFDMSELEGRIHAVRGSQPGQSSSSDRISWPTSFFTITDGRIVNGQFTAVLTAGDSDPNTPFNESVRGYMGHILGEFFGPNAEEVGAVVSASRDVAGEDHDYVLYGFVGGNDFGPAKTLGSEGILAGVLRDLDTSTTELREEGVTATVQRTENGWTVTVGDRTVEFQDSDYASHPAGPTNYVRAVDGGEAWFWTLTGGFGKTPEFNHFDVKGWGWNDQVSQGVYSGVSTNDLIIHGDRTPDSAMPTSGTATYGGRMEAYSFPTDDAVFTGSNLRISYRGDVALTADFANAGVTGDMTVLESRTGRGSWSSATGDATFNAAINGNLFSADNLNGSGDLASYQNGNVNGAFFGPAAEEAAGVFDAQDQAANRVLYGWFGTTKDDE
ncbi:MAG: transferrin-binding protein-like solute binding protein [Gammaproteobacteria bacterium]|nr:transferrin-binding protein-like solute binding protein [Gammaproteobacteria bacterium]